MGKCIECEFNYTDQCEHPEGELKDDLYYNNRCRYYYDKLDNPKRMNMKSWYKFCDKCHNLLIDGYCLKCEKREKQRDAQKKYKKKELEKEDYSDIEEFGRFIYFPWEDAAFNVDNIFSVLIYQGNVDMSEKSGYSKYIKAYWIKVEYGKGSDFHIGPKKGDGYFKSIEKAKILLEEILLYIESNF